MHQSMTQLPNQKFQIRDPQSPIRIFLFLLFTSYFLLLISCEKQTTPPQPPNPQVTLTAEAGVIEAWLSISVQDRNENLRFEILRDDSLVLNGPLTTDDTTLCDTGLLPAHTYTYTAQLLKNGQTAARSASVEIITLDTTSHDFQWEMFEFGGAHGSSVLYDVAIVNENDIWAVGEIHTAETDTFDSLGNWVSPYNAVHWDGGEWGLKRIRTNACGGVDYPPIKTIFAFSSNDVLFAHIDGSITHYNGSTFTNDCSLIIQLNGSAEKMWGLSRNDLYVVSGNGFIAHYNSQDWRRIYINTELDFRDIWGVWNSEKKNWEIIAVASKQFVNYNRLILQISANSQTILSDRGISWSLGAVWFSPNRKYFVAGAGIYEKGRLSEEKWKNGLLDITQYYTHGIRGNNINDVVAAGGAGEVIHFNGITWKSFFDVTHLGYGNYYAVDIQDNLIVVAGIDVPRGIIAVGRRITP